MRKKSWWPSWARRFCALILTHARSKIPGWPFPFGDGFGLIARFFVSAHVEKTNIDKETTMKTYSVLSAQAVFFKIFVGRRKIDSRHEIGVFSTSLPGLAVERYSRLIQRLPKKLQSDKSHLTIEDDAKAARRGLWSLPDRERIPP